MSYCGLCSLKRCGIWGDPMGKKTREALIGIFIQAAIAIEEPLGRIIALDPDIEAVHQYRVKIRQLRSLIAFLRPKLNKEIADQINKRLKTMASQFSSVREWDVLAQRWQMMADDQNSEHQEFTQRLTEVKQQTRIDAYARFQPRMVREDLDWIITQLRELFEDDRQISALIDKRLTRWLKGIRKGIKSLDVEDYPAMHDLRIRIKRLRYALTLLGDFADESMKDKIKPSKQWAEQLGIVCDAKRNKELLDEYIVRDIGPKILFLKSLKSEADEQVEQLKRVKL